MVPPSRDYRVLLVKLEVSLLMVPALMLIVFVVRMVNSDFLREFFEGFFCHQHRCLGFGKSLIHLLLDMIANEPVTDLRADVAPREVANEQCTKHQQLCSRALVGIEAIE